MKCRDFERLINEQLDAREAAAPDLERALEDHGSACPSCRAIASRYRTLCRAIAALGPPAAPADFADRFLIHWEHAGSEVASSPRTLKLWPVLAPVATAAGLLLATWLGVRPGGPAPPATPRGSSPPLARSIDPDALSQALVEATAATWDLARATSAPAARVGLDVLDADAISETTSLALPVEVAPASEVLQDVGERVNEEVRPLSGTARHAFGFLLGPALGPPVAPPPPSHGA